jgi:hypothetical protein
MIISFGALAPKLSEQIPALPPEYDDDADAITRLHCRGLLLDAETRRARGRLMKKINRRRKEV